MDVKNRLFVPERKLRPELWRCIKLVAPTDEKRKCKTKDAVGAYCLQCNEVFKYTAGTSKQIERHMIKYHPDDLATESKKRRQASLHEAIKKVKPVNESLAQKSHNLVLKWICESYRPMSIVEDPGLISLIEFVNLQQNKYTLPSRTTMTRLLKYTYEETVINVKAILARECKHFSLTSDVWTSRTSEAYISLMLHYLTDTFDMKVMTLRCAPFSNVRHTGIEIANVIRNSLEDANLCLSDLVMYVTDNASNAKASATELSANHQGCVAHTLNLVVQKLNVIINKVLMVYQSN